MLVSIAGVEPTCSLDCGAKVSLIDGDGKLEEGGVGGRLRSKRKLELSRIRIRFWTVVLSYSVHIPMKNVKYRL